MKDRTSDDYSKTIRRHAVKTAIACALCWGIPYMQICATEKEHSLICPFCGQPLAGDAERCHDCRKHIIDEAFEQPEASK